MNDLLVQTELLEQLAHAMVDEVSASYDFLVCKYSFMEDYDTIGSSLKLIKDGIECYPDTRAGFATKNLEICLKLRKMMSRQTGGEWTSFELTLDADDKAHTKFRYGS